MSEFTGTTVPLDAVNEEPVSSEKYGKVRPGGAVVVVVVDDGLDVVLELKSIVLPPPAF